MLDMAKHFLCDNIQIIDDSNKDEIHARCVLIDESNVQQGKHLLHMKSNENNYYVCNGIYDYYKGKCELNISLQNVVPNLPQNLKE